MCIEDEKGIQNNNEIIMIQYDSVKNDTWEQTLCHTPVITAPRRLREEDFEMEAN
jgi:hypothetical protein